MIINDSKLIEIFFDCDDFCKIFEQMANPLQIGSVRRPTRRPGLSLSECMCIMITYHHSGIKCFQYYYQRIVEKSLKSYFPQVPSYNRFVELMPRTVIMLFLFVNIFRRGKEMGCYFADSKKLPVCDNLRIKRNRVFKGIAGRSKSSTGWFYGLKLFLVINPVGEIINCFVTPANVADNNISAMKRLFKKLKGWLFADKGFISQQAFDYFYSQGLKVVTTTRSNMKNKLMIMAEKLLRLKRGVIESVNDILMTICDIDHTRHRSPINALAHIFAGIAAYSYLDKKPSLLSKKFTLDIKI
jgi:uncharacterized protein (DUF2164 family)